MVEGIRNLLYSKGSVAGACGCVSLGSRAGPGFMNERNRLAASDVRRGLAQGSVRWQSSSERPTRLHCIEACILS